MKNQQIQGVRGLAILLILIFHFYQAYFQMISYDGFANTIIFRFASYGNLTFFLITGAYLGNSQGGVPFIKKRLIALWPKYILACTILFLVYRCFHIEGKQFSIVDYLFNIFFVNGYTGVYLDGAHWFLAILVRILFVYSLIFLFDKEKRAIIELAWLVMIFVLGVCSNNDLGIIGKASGILESQIGGAYAAVVVLGRRLNRNIKDLHWKDVLVVIASFLLFVYNNGALGALDIILCVCCVWLALNNRMKFLECRMFIFLGNISFALFLIHQNIGYIAMQQARKLLDNSPILPFIGMVVGIIAGVSLEAIYRYLKKAVTFIKNKKGE